MRIAFYLDSTIATTPLGKLFVKMLTESFGLDACIYNKVGMNEDKYEIVHFIGFGDYKASRTMSHLTAMGIATTWSPLGGMLVWNKKCPSKKGFSLNSNQRNMLSKAKAIHAWSQLELEMLSDIPAASNKTAYIPNAVVTKKLSPNQMGEKFTLLYQKVSDTYVELLIDENLRNIIKAIITVGLTPLLVSKMGTEIKSKLALLSNSQWRHMMLYAYDEGITPLMHQVIDTLQVDAPKISITEIDRFEREYMTEDSCATPENEQDATQTLFEILRNTIHRQSTHHITLARYVEIFKLLRYTDYDEDCLMHLLQKASITKQARMLLSNVVVYTGLTEGFIPKNLYTLS